MGEPADFCISGSLLQRPLKSSEFDLQASELGRRDPLHSYETCEVKLAGKHEIWTRVEVVLLAVRNATANGNALAQKLFDRLLREVTEEGP